MRREAKSQQRKKVKMHKMQFVEVQTVRVLMGRSSFMKRKEVLKFQTSDQKHISLNPTPRSDLKPRPQERCQSGGAVLQRGHTRFFYSPFVFV